MKLFVYGEILSCALGLNPASAQQSTVTIGGNSRSLYFGPIQRLDFNNRVQTSFFTTSDGFTDRFPNNQIIGGNTLFSGELRTNGVNSYEADLATFTQGLGWSEYGSISASLPTDDPDGN